MVPIRLILAVLDEQYINPFLHYVRSSEFSTRVSVSAFSKLDSFLQYMDDDEECPDIVIGESCFLKPWMTTSKEKSEIPWICLSENGREDMNGRILSKYQPLQQLLSTVLETLQGNTVGTITSDGKASVIGVYAVSGGSGKTTVSLNIAKQLAADGLQVLYLNLETINSSFIGDLTQEADGAGLARLLYDLKAFADEGTPPKYHISSYTYKHPGWQFELFTPVANLNEMLQMNSKDTLQLIDFAVVSGHYDVIVVDVDSDMNERTTCVIQRCDRLVWLLIDDLGAMHKSEGMLNHWEKTKTEQFKPWMSKTMFTVNRYLGSLINNMPRTDMELACTLPYVPAWKQVDRQDMKLNSAVFQRDLMKLCRLLWDGQALRGSLVGGGR